MYFLISNYTVQGEYDSRFSIESLHFAASFTQKSVVSFIWQIVEFDVQLKILKYIYEATTWTNKKYRTQKLGRLVVLYSIYNMGFTQTHAHWLVVDWPREMIKTKIVYETEISITLYSQTEWCFLFCSNAHTKFTNCEQF